MRRYVVIRILQGIVTLFVLSIVIFFLPRTTGDPTFLLLGSNATPEAVQELRGTLGLDKPLPVQYAIFVKNAARGDFGKSLFFDRPVTEIVMQRLPNTVKLALAGGSISLIIGILLGVLCALHRNKAIDWIGRTIVAFGQSVPGFWVGIMLILLFSATLKVLPSSGMGGPQHYILPVITMGLPLLAGLARLSRSSMLETLGSDYITFVRARGASERTVILKHALKNAAIPIVTLSAVLFAFLLTGSVIIETVFAWPGMGRLAYQSVVNRDFPAIQLVVLIYGIIIICANLLADLLYALIDPRIRYQ